MPYLGNLPAERFTSFDKQTITGNGGTSYTLDHAVGNEQEIEVFVNNVRQEPSVAYTVAGTALTMTGNVESSDDFYVVFQGKATQTATHPETFDLKAVNGTFSGDVTVNGDLTVDTDTLYVDSTDGNVGIGTTSPISQSKLTVAGNSLSITGYDNGFTSGGNRAMIDFGANYMRLGGLTGGGSAVNGIKFIKPDGGEAAILDSDGLKFNGDTAAANALDDYEEGDWTPTLYGSSTTGVPVYGTTRGRYNKIGNNITVSFRVSVSSWTTAPSGTLCIGGLPYDNGSASQEWTGSFMADGVDFSATYYVTSCLYLSNNAGFLRIYHTRDNNGWTADSINNEAQSIIGTITYRTD